ncbi:MAG: type IIL restriction-modification enzyme MmeI [Cypionkella sp.]
MARTTITALNARSASTHTEAISRGRIDLYRRGCFIKEAKQGTDAAPTSQLALLDDAVITQKAHAKRGSAKWDNTMLRARNQADRYARAVAKKDGWPPFLLMVDVGHAIEVYADFSCQGQGGYTIPRWQPLSHEPRRSAQPRGPRAAGCDLE